MPYFISFPTPLFYLTPLFVPWGEEKKGGDMWKRAWQLVVAEMCWGRCFAWLNWAKTEPAKWNRVLGSYLSVPVSPACSDVLRLYSSVNQHHGGLSCEITSERCWQKEKGERCSCPKELDKGMPWHSLAPRLPLTTLYPIYRNSG